MNRARRPPLIDGLAPSTWRLPPGSWVTVVDALEVHFPHVSREQWLARIRRGRVLDAQGLPVSAESTCSAGAHIHYYREVPAEIAIPFREEIVYADDHLLVADKPHFLPVAPVGQYVRETLLARLIRRTGNPDLVPLHRIDRGTAGLVLFSANISSRAAYQALFRVHGIRKRYLALAAPMPTLQFPLVRKTRIVRGQPFIRSAEVPGVANAETHIEVESRAGRHWLYALTPVTGKKHQLRVHLSALGAPIVNDELYPELALRAGDDFTQPLKLLARCLEFVDPVTGEARTFMSRRALVGL